MSFGLGSWVELMVAVKQKWWDSIDTVMSERPAGQGKMVLGAMSTQGFFEAPLKVGW